MALSSTQTIELYPRGCPLLFETNLPEYGQIKTKLERWSMTAEYQDKWVVYDGADVSIVNHLSSTRHRSICLVRELGCVLG
jgi:hypothetical protein